MEHNNYLYINFTVVFVLLFFRFDKLEYGKKLSLVSF